MAAQSVPQQIQSAAADAAEAGLVYVYEREGGITRLRRGRGFMYLKDGVTLRDKRHMERIRKLAIPPAWRDVWICDKPNGHLQATGYDERGRRQYRYHADWRAKRDENKFSNMLIFGRALPDIRRKVLTAMNQDGLTKEKVTAAVIRLLDRTGLRVGSDEYMVANDSYGLTTIRKKHLELHGKEIEFHFPAKGRKVFRGRITDIKVAKVIAECVDVPGYRLFKYLNEDGTAASLDSADINAWLHDHTGQGITAKDFRTWNACTLFLEEALRHCGEGSKFELKPVLEAVARKLGNTPAILRRSYVHPQLIDLYRAGCLMEARWNKKDAESRPGLNRVEAMLLAWLELTYGRA